MLPQKLIFCVGRGIRPNLVISWIFTGNVFRETVWRYTATSWKCDWSSSVPSCYPSEVGFVVLVVAPRTEIVWKTVIKQGAALRSTKRNAGELFSPSTPSTPSHRRVLEKGCKVSLRQLSRGRCDRRNLDLALNKLVTTGKPFGASFPHISGNVSWPTDLWNGHIGSRLVICCNRVSVTRYLQLALKR